MAENHAVRWAFSADLPSSPPSGNHPEASDPHNQPTTFRAPSTAPSESDETLAAVEDDVVREHALQDVEMTAEEEARQLADWHADGYRSNAPPSSPFTLQALEEMAQEFEDYRTGRNNCRPQWLDDPHDGVHAEGDDADEDLEMFNIGVDEEGEDRMEPRSIGLVLIWNMRYIDSEHKSCQQTIAKMQQASRREQLETYVDVARPCMRSMSKSLIELQSDDIQNITNTLFQSQEAEALVTYFSAQSYYRAHKYELHLLRGDLEYAETETDADLNTETDAVSEPGGGEPSQVALRDDIAEEIRVPMRPWDDATADPDVQAALHHLRAAHQECLDEIARSNQVTDEAQELLEKLKKFRERQMAHDADGVRVHIHHHHQMKRKEAFRQAPWRRRGGYGDPYHLKRSPLHRRRHRLWRTCTPRAVWMHRVGTMRVADAVQEAPPTRISKSLPVDSTTPRLDGQGQANRGFSGRGWGDDY
ncbi:hypothetical protein PG994_013593 [Apiospora phragmitis]|uniref:Uncharacterized protein n=1 Tax=Apiospora phragmitis TaxID=2905665 RepID=A0ABR1T940_9PEZI